MTYALTLGWPAPALDRGFSGTARAVGPNVAAIWAGATPSIAAEERRRAAIRSLQSALSGAQEDGWDGYQAKPADPDAFIYAVQLLDELPTAVPLPDVAVDSDGDIALEWDRGPRKLLSLRVSRDGTIYYAGLLGYATFHGSEQLREGIPSAISKGIERVLSEPR